MRRLNPFAGLPNGREVWAWGMYDLANQSFTLLILTLLFPIYFREVAVQGGQAKGDSLWSITYASSQLLVVLISPFVGAVADTRGTKKRFLISTGLFCVAFTCAFALIGPGGWPLAMALFIVGNVFYQLGENFMASFLPEVSTPRTIGRISAIGWTMGYIGALLILALTIAQMQVFGWGPVEKWRPLFVFTGLWFLGGMIAPALILREAPPALGVRPAIPAALREGLRRVVRTARSAAQYRQLVLFLTAFFVYSFGMATMIAFAGILARDFGFEQVKLVIFVLQLTVTAGAGAVVAALIQDRIGARTTVLLFLGVWIATSLAMVSLTIPANPPQWMFWVAGNGVGLGLGGAGTASRAMVGLFTPRQKTGEFFGLWGMVYKGAAVVGVLSFGQVKAFFGGTASLVLLTGFFVAGALLLLRVSERSGVRAARRAERVEEKMAEAARLEYAGRGVV